VSGNDETMNCDDYREALAADPGFDDESGHASVCTDCRAFKSEMLALNAKIARALQIDVPELVMPTLPDIDAGNVAQLPGRRKSVGTAWYAIAATVVLAVFFAYRSTLQDDPGFTLEQQVLAHVDHAPEALLVTTTPVSATHLAEAVPDSIATMNQDVGLITFAESCEINGNDVPHLVIQGARGPVTILLMPEEHVGTARSFEGVNIKGVILPVGKGSIAIIGDRDEELGKYEENVMNSVAWGA